MARCNTLSDKAYEGYKKSKEKIKELQSKRDEIAKKWKETRDTELWKQWENLGKEIELEIQNKYTQAVLVTEYIYEAEE